MCVAERVTFMCTFGQSVQRGKRRRNIMYIPPLKGQSSNIPLAQHHRYASVAIGISERDGTGLKLSIASVVLLWTAHIILKCFSDPTRFKQIAESNCCYYSSWVRLTCRQDWQDMLRYFIAIQVYTCWFYQHFKAWFVMFTFFFR